MKEEKMIENVLGKKDVKTKSVDCKICEEEFTYEVKRGRQPQICPSKVCRSTHRKATRKPLPKVVRRHNCNAEGCENEIVQEGRGRTIKWCDTCRTQKVNEMNREYRKQSFEPTVREQGNCKDCNCELGTKTGRGKLLQRCDDCRKARRNKQATASAKKRYEPKIRKYICIVCEKEGEQVGRGKARKTCPDCKKPSIKKVAQQKTTLEDEGVSELDVSLYKGMIG